MKDSFTDRISDGLSQELLKYLPFKDKLRLESVSKQFQRTIYTKQYILFLGPNNNYEDVSKSTEQSIRNNECLAFTSQEALESVLKKCRNISEIYIIDESYNPLQNDGLISAVFNHCHNLDAIKCSFDGLTDKKIAQFLHRFGEEIRKLGLYDEFRFAPHPYNRHLIKYMPNINELTVSSPKWLRGQESEATHLTKLALWLIADQRETIEAIIDANWQTLSYIHFYSHNYQTPQMYSLFERLKRVKGLKSFRFDNFRKEWMELSFNCPFHLYLRQLSVNCQQIREICIKLYTNSGVNRNVFFSIKYFYRLKRLSLHLVNELESDHYNYSSQSLAACKQLERLCLNVSHITDEFFVNSDTSLKRLQQIELKNTVISEEAFQWLAKHSKLEAISLTAKRGLVVTYVPDVTVNHIINNNPRLRSIKYMSEDNALLDVTDEDTHRIRQESKNIKLYSITSGRFV
ncbi:unnamed protein product [Medioppia subpectinata]|uniref:F-box domain-containing protein n=1 Tax=Medioppia subpectinata TaxID=1979941 RepID=A0A7R9L063_9ACAR|nr:unnamed protein product [Medioppia subpectinata]CAG2111985.1 unnamed protein product [Medioppia subpectinata]